MSLPAKKSLAQCLPARFWLMKTEPDVFSFADLCKRKNQQEDWDGVRNYQARNLMRDHMRVGDGVVFYHSNAEPPGMAGLARVVAAAKADLSALNPKSEYFDEKATPENPRWCCVTVGRPLVIPKFVSLEDMRKHAGLREMLLLHPGQRLSILPLALAEFEILCALAGLSAGQTEEFVQSVMS
jgi:predicted RNA-binding protein with PUA-like domain